MSKINHLLTIREVADKLRLGERTVYRLIESKRLKAIKVSRKAYRVSESELKKFLKKCEE